MSDDFMLHERLAADTHVVGDLALSRVLLMDDARFPWVIVVPRRDELVDYIDLANDDCAVLQRELSQVGAALQAIFEPDKLNIAALGNRVPQLHVHVIARYRDDAAWPDPVWGRGEAVPYATEAAAKCVAELRDALHLRD